MSKKKPFVVSSAIEDAQKAIAEEENNSATPILEITSFELENLRLLCSFLGLGRNACLSSAVNYCCSIIARSEVVLPAQKIKKESKTNPKEKIEYSLSAEALTNIRSNKNNVPQGWPTNETDFIRMSLSFFGKKLLPPKSKMRKKP